MIRNRRTMSRTGRRASGAARPSAAGASPEPAPLVFGDRPVAGRNNLVWLGTTASPADIVKIVERLTGYQVSALWRLTHGGWQAHLPGGESSIRFVDALDRLVVVLQRAA